MSQVIEKNPVVTAAIREIKAELKEFAVRQRQTRKEHREAQRNQQPHRGVYATENITALHIFYQRLRQTKRPHLDEAKWKGAEGFLGIRRKRAFKQEYDRLVTKYPSLKGPSTVVNPIAAEFAAELAKGVGA